MAGPGKGTWVKVKGKNGAVRTEVIGATVGGNNYSKGEVISQSEYQKTQERKSEGTNQSSGNARIQVERLANASNSEQTIALRDRRRQAEQKIRGAARAKLDSLVDQERKKGREGSVSSAFDRFDRTKAGKKDQALSKRRLAQYEAEKKSTSDGSGNRAKRRLAEMRGQTVPKYKSLGEARLGFQKQQKQEGKRLQKAALSKAEKTQILLKNKKQLKKEAMKTEGGYDRVKRLNRIEAADRKRRKAENPNAPSFRRAQKGNQTKYLKSLGIG